MNPKLKGQTLSKCRECSMAKSKKGSVKKKGTEATRSKQVGDNIASDLKEMYAAGTGGSKWMGSAIDTYSRYALIVAIKTKGDFAKHYEDIVAWYRNQTGKPHKQWTTDGGGEFNNAYIDKVNKRNGIQHQITPPHNSRKNPYAERFNRTIGEAVAAILLTAEMAVSWWVEAAQYVVYIYNRTPHKGLNMKTPYEIFHKKPHHHVPIYVFGCLAYVHNHLHSKKDVNKTRRAVFLGIDASGRYKFEDLDNKARFTSDTADFHETIFPKGKDKARFQTTQGATKADIELELWTLKNSGQIFLLDDELERESGRPIEPNGTPNLTETHNTSSKNVVSQSNSDFSHSRGSIPCVSDLPEEHRTALEEAKHSPSGDINHFQQEECISNPEDQVRRSTRFREPSLAGLESLANTPPVPRDTHGTGRLNYRDIEALANAVLYDKTVPISYHAAVLSPDWPKWKEAIDKEIAALQGKKTFEEVYTLPQHKQALTCRWVFKVKPPTEHEKEIFKARLVVQGFRQKEGKDFGETFAAVARTNSLRILIALAAAHNTRMTKLDVANAFLSSKMDVELYVKTPDGYPSKAPFLKLLQALYGLKQAPRLWYRTLIEELIKMGFQIAPTDTCVLTHKDRDCKLVIVVDDMIVCTNDEQLRSDLERKLDEKFKIKAFGDVKSYVGLEIEYKPNSLILHQRPYILKLLERFGMQKCKPAKTPASTSQAQDMNLDKPAPKGTPYRELVGSLLYLFATRPDICVSVIKLSMHLENPTVGHWMQAKRVLRYLAGTMNKGIEYPKNISKLHLWAHTDSDWAGCKTTRRSTSGYAVFLNQGPICWKSKMQSIVALSSCEAEYISLVECIKEILWLLQHFKVLGVTLESPVIIGIDNLAALALAKNPVLHEKTKHIDTRHHFIRQAIHDGLIKLQYINTGDNIADILTKHTKQTTFEKQTDKLIKQIAN